MLRELQRGFAHALLDKDAATILRRFMAQGKPEVAQKLLEHVRAIAGTPAAKTAASELSGGVKRLAHELRNEARRVTEAADEQMAGEEEADEPDKPARPTRQRAAAQGDDEKPRKVVPRLVREPAASASTPNGANE